MNGRMIALKEALLVNYYMIKNEVLNCALTLTYRYNILSRTETAEQIAAGKSVCRFGDGELGMLFGDPVCFQHDDEILKARLEGILQSVETCSDSILVCLPGAMNRVNDMLDAPRKHWVNWNASHLKRLSPFISKKYVYGDTNVSRLWLAWKDKSRELQIVKAIQKALENKNIVVVEGRGVRFGDGNDMLDGCRSVRRIICPATDAFDKYNEILSCCKKMGGGGRSICYCTGAYGYSVSL